MSLRIAFNATPLLSPLTGIGNYIVELGRALAATGEVDTYAFYGGRWGRGGPAPSPSSTQDAAVRRLRNLVKPLVPFGRELRHFQQQHTFGHGLRRHAIELYHEPNYVPLCYDVPVVTTVHDLSWLHYPEAHPVDRVRWLEKGLPIALERSAAILVDSEFVRQEVLSTFGVAPERVTVAHLGVDERFHPRSADETASVLVPAGLVHGSYLLTVGTIEPRKNLGVALDAYASLPTRLRERYPLVVAGGKGWRSSTIESRLRDLEARGQARFLGFVQAADLPVLYAGARAFVFPSLYEGFGLPPLEAMASGVPVLVSNRSAIPEVVGDCGVMFDPERVGSLAETLEAALDDSDSLSRRVADGLARAQTFTWARCAQTTLEVYRRVRAQRAMDCSITAR